MQGKKPGMGRYPTKKRLLVEVITTFTSNI
jgi:hypothetical protein